MYIYIGMYAFVSRKSIHRDDTFHNSRKMISCLLKSLIMMYIQFVIHTVQKQVIKFINQVSPYHQLILSIGATNSINQ